MALDWDQALVHFFVLHLQLRSDQKTWLKFGEGSEMPVPCSPTHRSASLVPDKGDAWTLPTCEQQQRVCGSQELLLHPCGS